MEYKVRVSRDFMSLYTAILWQSDEESDVLASSLKLRMAGENFKGEALDNIKALLNRAGYVRTDHIQGLPLEEKEADIKFVTSGRPKVSFALRFVGREIIVTAVTTEQGKHSRELAWAYDEED